LNASRTCVLHSKILPCICLRAKNINKQFRFAIVLLDRAGAGFLPPPAQVHGRGAAGRAGEPLAVGVGVLSTDWRTNELDWHRRRVEAA